MSTSFDLPRKNEEPKTFFNPLKKDLLIDWRDDDNVVHTITIPSMELSTYPTYQADHMIKNIVTAIKNERNIKHYDEEAEKQILNEITV